MAKLTRAEITASINNSFPDNSSKQITEEILRTEQEQLNESFYNLEDDSAEDVKVNDPEFTANNVLAALKEVKDGGDRPLFYIDLKLVIDANGYEVYSHHGSNFNGTDFSNTLKKFTFPNVETKFGKKIRASYFASVDNSNGTEALLKTDKYEVNFLENVYEKGTKIVHATDDIYRYDFYPLIEANGYVSND